MTVDSRLWAIYPEKLSLPQGDCHDPPGDSHDPPGDICLENGLDLGEGAIASLAVPLPAWTLDPGRVPGTCALQTRRL